MRLSAVTLFLFVSFLFAQDSTVVIFLSDTQTPIWAEKILLDSRNNEQAKQRIFSSVLDEKNLEAVIHAGDITGHGWLRSSWRPILPFLDSLRSHFIPFIAAKGNHDYYFYPPWGKQHFREYVPNGNTEYSLHRIGDLGILILNSNHNELSEEIRSDQRRWYRDALCRLDADTTIRTIISVAHHSPFTNSALVSGSDYMREEYLPFFYLSPKSSLWIGGHAHRFEHFQSSGKDFFVIGGGGGLFHHIKETDLIGDQHCGDGRFFHYLRCTAVNGTLHLEAVRIFPDSTSAQTVYNHTIPSLPLKTLHSHSE